MSQYLRIGMQVDKPFSIRSNLTQFDNVLTNAYTWMIKGKGKWPLTSTCINKDVKSSVTLLLKSAIQIHLI